MKLAEEIIVTIGGEAVTLRPSLRLAIRLERRPGSFSGLLREIMDGSLTAAIEIIEPHADGLPFLESRVFDTLPNLKGPLVSYVMALAGIDPADAPAEGKPKGKSVPFNEHLASLYRIGTGWMGWDPETTLDATPAEITEAYKGRLELLRAVFGTKEETQPKDDRPLDQKFRSIFASHQVIREQA